MPETSCIKRHQGEADSKISKPTSPPDRLTLMTNITALMLGLQVLGNVRAKCF